MSTKPWVVWMTSAVLTFAVPAARAGSVDDSVGGSVALSTAVGASVMITPIFAANAGGQMFVESVRLSGQTAVVVLKGAGDSAKAVVEVSADVARKAGLSASQAVDVVAQGSGYLLVASGQVLAFVPNTLGNSLIHSSKSR
jgi:hypothetical protein